MHIEDLFTQLEETLLELARIMEERLPHEMRQVHWIKQRTSPAPWTDLLFHYQATDVDTEKLAALSVRAMVAEMAGKLLAEKTYLATLGQPIHIPKLAKVRRSS